MIEVLKLHLRVDYQYPLSNWLFISLILTTFVPYFIARTFAVPFFLIVTKNKLSYSSSAMVANGFVPPAASMISRAVLEWLLSI
jgi:hypothetical protein